MTPKEFESNLVSNLNEAMRSGVHPSIIHTILHSKAYDLLMMLKQPPPPDGDKEPDSPLIVLPPARGG